VQRRGYLLSCGRSVGRNSREAGLVAEPWEYRWASAQAYGLGEADPLLSDNPEYLGLADSPARRQERRREFPLGDDPREEVVGRGDWAVGDEEFRRRVLVAQGRPAPRRRGRPPKVARAGR
jgi:hypothetical protein